METPSAEPTVAQVHDGPVEGFVPDTAESYKGDPTFAATLPTGAKFLLKRPNIMALMQRGDIPNPLIGIIEKAFKDEDIAENARGLADRAKEAGRSVLEQQQWENENGIGPDGEAVEEGKENVPDVDVSTSEALGFMDLLVWASVVLPPLSFEDPVDATGKLTAGGQLSINGLSDDDKMFIFSWANDQLEGVATFRAGGAEPDPVGNGGTLRAAPERSAGDTSDAREPVAPPVS